MKFISRTLGDISDEVGGIIRTGPFGSQLHEADYQEQGTPVVMPKDIIDGRISVESIARIGNDDVHRLSQHKLQEGDIVYGRRGDIGRRAIVSRREAGWICGTGCLRISVGNQVLDPMFLYYYLGNPSVIAWIANQAIGATLPNLNTAIIRKISIKYPDLLSQAKIVAVLSAYNDLIENNTKRITILEEMAQSLYREWFVLFRYPGYEKDEMVASGSKMMPENWGIVELGSLAKEVRRSVNPEAIDPETPYFGLEHLPRKSIALAEWGAANEVHSTKFSFREGEILFGKIRPYFHKVGVAPLDGICSSDTIVIKPKSDEYFSVVLSYVSSEDFVNYAAQTSQGTKMPRANWEILMKYPVVLPPDPLLTIFNNIINDIVGSIRNLVFRNRNLRHTRDLLLPKLISGEIDVESLNIPTPDVIDHKGQQPLFAATRPEPIKATQIALPLL